MTEPAAKPASTTGGPPRIIRTAGRRLALMLLYAWEQNRYVDDGGLMTSDELLSEDPAAVAYGRELFAVVIANRTPIDAAIDQRLDNWTIHRLAVADRAILRLGAAEILYRADTPPRVAINEAIELGKLFGSDAKTAKLVNGVLDRLARDHRPDEVRPKAGGGTDVIAKQG